MMEEGIVKWYNPRKGFGFIELTKGGEDVFIHKSKVEEAGLSGLEVGQKLTFELEMGRNDKPAAANIKIVEESVSNDLSVS